MARDIRSVFEIGCSLGYLPRFAETEMFPAAVVVLGYLVKLKIPRDSLLQYLGVSG